MEQRRCMNASRKINTLGAPKTMKVAVVARVHRPVRGRPTAEQVNSIDRAIVDTARRMFLADGFDSVAMKQVAETARVSKGTLYARYPSKEALFKAVIEQSIEDWSAEASQQDPMLMDSIEQRLRHHARIISIWLGRPDVLALQRLLLSVRERFPELSNVMRDRGYSYIVGLIAQDIEVTAAKEGRTVSDAGAVARLLVSGITGAQMQENMGSQPEDDLQGFAQRVVDMLVYGQVSW